MHTLFGAAKKLALLAVLNGSTCGDSSLKTLHKYLVGQVVASLLLTVAVFAFILLLMKVLKDLLPLVLGGHVGLWLAGKSIGLLLPFCMVFALPMGFITAT